MHPSSSRRNLSSRLGSLPSRSILFTLVLAGASLLPASAASAQSAGRGDGAEVAGERGRDGGENGADTREHGADTGGLEAVEETGLDAADRIGGLSLIWKEAAYNFPYFDRLPDLDWDAAYREFVPRVLGAESTLEYYRELHRFTALLRDGHTRVELPDSILRRRPYSSPRVELRAVGGRPMVVNVGAGLADSLPVGSEIVEVDGTAVEAYLEREVLPLVFASAPHSRRISAIEGSHSRGYGLLVGPAGSAVGVSAVSPVGDTIARTLARDRFATEGEWVEPVNPGREPLVEFEPLEAGIAYLALNSFSDERIVAAVDSLLPDLRDARGVVLDLRANGGGSDLVAVETVARFTDGPFVGTASRFRIHDAYYRALGSFGRSRLERALPADSSELVERALRHFRGDAWRREPPDTLRSNFAGERVDGPVAVLIGRGTASAAENLLVRLPAGDRFFTVGSPSAASTGQPLVFPLPGGGHGQVVTRAALLPDGTPLVETGVVPDIHVEATIADIRRGRDPVLARAVEELERRTARGTRFPEP